MVFDQSQCDLHKVQKGFYTKIITNWIDVCTDCLYFNNKLNPYCISVYPYTPGFFTPAICLGIS